MHTTTKHGQTKSSRRFALKSGSAAFVGATAALARQDRAIAEVDSSKNQGMPPVRIRKVRAIVTAPDGNIRLVVVKVETSEPGLYGLGCATFNQRPLAVVTAVDKYLHPFCHNRNVDNIEDIWQNAYTSSYGETVLS